MTRNARITGTRLGFERGILTFYLFLEFGNNLAQVFGGGNISACAASSVALILNAVGVENWEDLREELVQVHINGGSEEIIGISPIIGGGPPTTMNDILGKSPV